MFTRRLTLALPVALLALTSAASAQGAAAKAILPPDQQIAAAVLPIRPDQRATATVFGYGADGKLTTLRDGTGEMTCLASDPKVERFHVACYHKVLEPFMARGRELRAQGVTGPEVDSVRFREVKAGKLKLPGGPAALYSLTGTTYDPATATAPGARPLFVLYIPNGTAESTGLSAKPSATSPWIMFPGTPKAHIMFTPTM